MTLTAQFLIVSVDRLLSPIMKSPDLEKIDTFISSNNFEFVEKLVMSFRSTPARTTYCNLLFLKTPSDVMTTVLGPLSDVSNS